jgi:hypothetical protein
MLGRINLRRRWRAAAALASIIGFAGTVVFAAVVGAQRTSTSFERFREYSRSADVEVLVDGRSATETDLRALERMDEIRDVARLQTYALLVGGEFIPTAAAQDERFGTVVDRPRVIRGRVPESTEPNAVAIGETLAEKMGIDAGDKLPVQSYTPEQVEAVFRGEDITEPQGPELNLDVVGIVRRPLDLAGRGAVGGVLVPTPAFNERYGIELGTFQNLVLRVRTHDGADDVPAVVERARELFGDSELFDVQSLGIETEGVRDAVGVLTFALALFATIAGVASAIFVALIAARQVRGTEEDQVTLTGVGMTRQSRVLAAALPVIVAGIGGALLATMGAVLASPLLPIGVARKADPDVGVHVDWIVLGFGVIAIVILVAIVAITTAWTMTRASHATREPPHAAGSAAGRFASHRGLAPAPAIGVGLALDAGRGARRAPVCSALVGVLLGAVGVAAVLVFSASLDHVVRTPASYGWSWDTLVLGNDENFPVAEPGQPCGAYESNAVRDPAFSAVASVCVFNVEVDGRPLTSWSFEPRRGVIEPTAIAGRAPSAADEIALGRETMRALGKRIGDRVTVQGPAASGEYVVVGQVVLPSPTSLDPQPLDDTAAFTGAGLTRVLPAERGTDDFHTVARLAPGTNVSALSRDANGFIEFRSGLGVEPTVPLEIERIRQVDQLPALLGLFLALLAGVTVAHALLSSVRRRGRDLAVLRVIGFNRRQVRAILASQATTYALIGGLIGIPLGILVGQRVWRAVAENLGVSTDAHLDVLAFLAVALLALVAANLLGAFAAWRALRARPAEALAAE